MRADVAQRRARHPSDTPLIATQVPTPQQIPHHAHTQVPDASYDFVAQNQELVRALPLWAGGIGFVSLLVNRIASGVRGWPPMLYCIHKHWYQLLLQPQAVHVPWPVRVTQRVQLCMAGPSPPAMDGESTATP